MIRILLTFMLVVLAVTINACRSPASMTGGADGGPITYRGLEWLTEADPVRDVAAAWERGDHRFIGVYGFAPYTPGLPKNAAEVVKANGVRYLAGTSDAVESAEHGRAVTRATEYARRYNTALLEKLQNAK